MLKVTQLTGFGCNRRPIIVVPIGRVSSISANTTYTFASSGFGAADATRIIVVGVMGRDATAGFSISSATIGSVAATLGGQRFDGIRGTGILWAHVPNGTTGTVTITFDEALSNSCSIYRWAVYNARLPALGSSANWTTATSVSTTLEAAAGGAILAHAISANNGSNLTYSAGVDNDDNVATDSERSAAGSRLQVASATPLTVTAVSAGAAAAIGIAAVSFQQK